MTAAATLDRVTARATRATQVPPAKILLTVLFAPLFVAGFVLGLLAKVVVFVAVFAYGAFMEGARVGWSKLPDVRRQAPPKAE